jgi:hypothetical protein
MIFRKKNKEGLNAEKNSKSQDSKKEFVAEKGVQGFLVPPYYRRQSKYRNGTIFRSTSLILIACLALGALQVYKYTLANNNKRVSEQTQSMEMDEASRLQQQSASLRPIKSKFKELEILRKQLRVPMAPVLDALEKTIPEEISINRIVWMCPPVSATGALKRRATIQIDAYFPDKINPNDELIMRWPDSIRERLPDSGLLMSQSEWGPPKKFEPTKEQAIKTKQKFGITRLLTITVELSN